MLGGVGSMNLKYNVKIFVGAARAGEAAPYLLSREWAEKFEKL